MLSAAGRIVAHAFRPVGLELTEDGGAEQSPGDWWEAVVASTREALADSGVAPRAGRRDRLHLAVVGHRAGRRRGRRHRSRHHLDGLAGARAVRETVRGALNVQGYSASKLARWVRRTGGIPSLSGKDPVGHIHFLRSERPDVYRAAAVFLEPVDYLNLRLTGLARASHDSITVHWVTDNRDVRAVAYDDQLVELAGLERATLPELVPTGSVLGGLAPGAAAELGLLAGTPVVAGNGRPALGRGGLGRGGRLRRAPLHRHIELDQLPRPLQEDRCADQHRLHPLGPPRPLPDRRRARDGGRLPDLAARQRALPRRPAGAGRCPPGDLFATLNDLAASVPAGAHGVLFTPWLNGERSPVDDHTIRGGFHNLSLSSTRSDMVRAVFDGVALNSAWLLGAVEKFTKKPFGSLAFVGGGANSDLWSQIHADATGPHHPPGGRSRPGQRARRRAAHPARPRAPDRGRTSRAPSPSRRPTNLTRRPSALYAGLLKEFVNLYEKTKGIHKRLNGRRLH